MEYKIVVLGGGGVGKSALCIQYIMKKFIEEYEPTQADQYRMQTTVDGESCYLEILDTAGQEDFGAIQDQYVEKGDGFLLVFAVDSEPSFKDIQQLHDRIMTVKEQSHFPILICANKDDLDTSQHIISKQQVADLCSKWNCQSKETSAKTRQNVDESFQEIVREIRRQAAPAQDSGGCSCSIL
ncbi:putative GTPase HRas [Blattamonas nauphoetae]|uniref:GTPase HRas n=1 Tax=Blattamonas nauphoetae TaxID=2049346 RepID=A0ABQ9WMU4_9EUKA|nr:putative GTPase HRas [Blattamonas nauphoetae]